MVLAQLQESPHRSSACWHSPAYGSSEAGGGADNSRLSQAPAGAQHQRQSLLKAVRGGGDSWELLSDLPGSLVAEL